mmetsp:Transcript_35306/g.59509  ORF Transcript_35306/g.59509 Transcript_35306/m.59509 type:complete len:272 (+) Transcript_35306:144-959(+)|eukprot:CAMPEP_0198214278 /NCGR_PEP_ID=MMETSP1445-20131203/40183_1 /TAXON_ID=36898 /ORGANISM="Pyramimonas sp., Strain CCMP2087" /LENGTH=271 /DNA_ID=CAMNT_0043889401 /DNA_START=49 /DNA_END=864 /DNA_ORIENTATION=-
MTQIELEGSSSLNKELERELRSGGKKSYVQSDVSSDPTLWEADPFYEAAEALDEEMDELHQTLARWRSVHTSTTQGAELEELEMLQCDLFTQCDSIESQVEEFQQALCISKLHPERFHLSLDEVHRRQEFVANISQQVATVRSELGGTTSEDTWQDPSTADRRVSTETPQDAEPAAARVNPSGALLRDMAMPPRWDVVKEEERKRQEEIARDKHAISLYLDAPLPRNFREEVQHRWKKWAGETDRRQLASVALLVFGVYGLHTFYGTEGLV